MAELPNDLMQVIALLPTMHSMRVSSVDSLLGKSRRVAGDVRQVMLKCDQHARYMVFELLPGKRISRRECGVGSNRRAPLEEQFLPPLPEMVRHPLQQLLMLTQH